MKGVGLTLVLLGLVLLAADLPQWNGAGLFSGYFVILGGCIAGVGGVLFAVGWASGTRRAAA